MILNIINGLETTIKVKCLECGKEYLVASENSIPYCHDEPMKGISILLSDKWISFDKHANLQYGWL